jgi:hypothetical protein
VALEAPPVAASAESVAGEADGAPPEGHGAEVATPEEVPAGIPVEPTAEEEPS